MIEFTPREITAIGERRWLKQSNRILKSIGALVLALAVALALSVALKGKISPTLVSLIMILVILLGFGYYFKVFIRDSEKAGKKFLEEYQKERQS